jgi:hypothetical protein
MGEIVNLTRVRKAAARKAARAAADANAARHGLPPAERRRQKAEADKTKRDLDAHRRDPDPGPNA